jgi:hypothetical protein
MGKESVAACVEKKEDKKKPRLSKHRGREESKMDFSRSGQDSRIKNSLLSRQE